MLTPPPKMSSPFDDDVAEIDADAEFDAPVGRKDSVALGHRALHRDGATHCVDDAGEFDQQPVTRRLDDAAAIFLDCGIRDLAPQLVQRGERALLVPLHQPRIARDIGGEDGGETAGGGHG
jgi:hypothetical protein